MFEQFREQGVFVFFGGVRFIQHVTEREFQRAEVVAAFKSEQEPGGCDLDQLQEWNFLQSLTWADDDEAGVGTGFGDFDPRPPFLVRDGGVHEARDGLSPVWSDHIQLTQNAFRQRHRDRSARFGELGGTAAG